MLLCMTDLLGLILSTILVLFIELIESALEHLVGILRYINVYVLLLLLLLLLFCVNKDVLTITGKRKYSCQVLTKKSRSTLQVKLFNRPNM